MIEDPIESVLSGRIGRAETREPVSCPVRSLVIEPTLDGSEQDLLKALSFPSPATVVCDANTHDVLAARVAKSVPGAKLAVIEAPNADERTAEDLAHRTRHAEALVAVGAGTLNDLVKYVSHRRHRPYVVFATAPSMNGYVTATASISRRGEKLSLPARPPLGAFFDLAVLAEAPKRMIRAGVGDSLCRSTAQIDWLLSHHLFDTAYTETPFRLQCRDEAELLSVADALDSGRPDDIRALVRLLVLGGLGMLIAGSSQPGSQGEHLISHYIDMMSEAGNDSLHGEQVGLATSTMAALQHHMLAQHDPPILTETSIDRDFLAKRFGPSAPFLETALTRKALSGDRLDATNRRLLAGWPNLRATLQAKALPLDRLRTTFAAAGVATDPRDLGIPERFYREAILHARLLRDRFTMLDLAADAGMLASFVDRHLFHGKGRG